MGKQAISHGVAFEAYSDVYEQYATDAAFLWLLRTFAVRFPHYTADDLTSLDRRIDAQLDGLMSAPENSWTICQNTLESGDAGDVFTASVLAFRSLDVNKIQAAVEQGLANRQVSKGLVSALAWVPARVSQPWIKRFLTSKDLDHKWLALAACSLRRDDPGDHLERILQRHDCVAHRPLYGRALRLIGELKRHDLARAVQLAKGHADPDIFFWANWSAVLLGDDGALANLQDYVLQTGPYQYKALNLVFNKLNVQRARSWIAALAKDSQQTRTVIKATAVLGDPHAVNWLVEQMRRPCYSRLAGEAFTTITGIDLEAHELALDTLPDLDDQLPDDDPAGPVRAVDEDEHLPFPDTDKVAATWQRYKNRFVPGQRYFLGQPYTVEQLSHVLLAGRQRHRQHAGMALALTRPEQPFVNVADRQRVDL